MTLALSAQQTRLLRLKSQRLLPSGNGLPTSAVETVEAVVGVQAQDLKAGQLSLRARSTGLTASEIEESRQVERSIAWVWCLRGTLHLVSAQDARWLVPFLGPGLIAGDRRRFEQLGWDESRAEDGLRLLQEALEQQRELRRPEVTWLLKAHNLPSEGQAPVHLIYRAALEGRLCLGPDRDGQPTYVPFETWLGEPQSLAPEEALAKIARRYLAAYAPAGPKDLASWSGLKLGQAREAWRLIADQIEPVEAAGQTAWLLKEQLPWLEGDLEKQAGAEPNVRLLPRYDTYWMGYARRDLSVDPIHGRSVHPGGGQISAVLLVNGMARGNWKTQRRKAVLEVRLRPFESLAEEWRPQLEAEVVDLGRFLEEEAVLIVED
jgi:hypothetical protein